MSVARLARIRSQFTSVADVWLAVRMFGWALVLPVLKRVVPVRSLARMMHRDAKSSTHQLTTSPARQVREAQASDRLLTFARWSARIVRPRSGGNCLERGLIAYRYLGAAGARPTLVVGLGRSEPGGVIGHAWVLLDGRPAGESEASVRVYTPVFAFGPDGTLLDAPPAREREGGDPGDGDRGNGGHERGSGTNACLLILASVLPALRVLVVSAAVAAVHHV